MTNELEPESGSEQEKIEQIVIPSYVRNKASLNSWNGFVTFAGIELTGLLPTVAMKLSKNSEKLSKLTLLTLSKKMKEKSNITQIRQAVALCRRVLKRIKEEDEYLYKKIKSAMSEVSMLEVLHREMKSEWLNEKEKGNIELFDKLPETLA